MLRSILFLGGLAITLTGALWIGQGLGYVNWPADSAMLGQQSWADRGVILAVAGLLLILVARRIDG